MGANFHTVSLKGDLDRTAVKETFQKAQEEDRYENGHSYSGGFGMASGLKFVDQAPFADCEAARAFLDLTCEKWEEAIAIRYKREDGTLGWMIGAVCAS